MRFAVRSRLLLWALWPAFLAACALELVVFAVVDPLELHLFGQPIAFSRQAIYTGAFFVFWGISLVAGYLTALLSLPPSEINDCPVPVCERPEGCRPPS